MRIPTATAEAQIEIKKSRFIALALPVNSLKPIREMVKEKKAEHPGAAHVVHAAVIGPSGSEYSMSDDGEPKGTSGRPALEVLKGSGITNLLVMIVRYFGGTKLGTGGLVKAYGEAVKAVLEELSTEELVEKTEFQLHLSYADHGSIQQIFQKHQVEILNEEFAMDITIQARCPDKTLQEITPLLQNATNGKSKIKTL